MRTARRERRELPEGRLLSFAEAALVLNCSVGHVRYLVRTGKLRAEATGRTHRNGLPVRGIPLTLIRWRAERGQRDAARALARLAVAAEDLLGATHMLLRVLVTEGVLS